MSNQNREEHEHLAEVDDGAGCTEIWETLSERREQGASSKGRNVETGGNVK